MQLYNTKNFSNWSLTNLITLSAVICFVCIFFFLGFNEESVRLNIRWSARFSIICFCLAFSASSIHAIYNSKFSKYLLSQRRYLGVAFALIHLIHLFFIYLLHYFFSAIFVIESLFELTFGGIAYLFVILMLLTSFEYFSNSMSSKTWKGLHKVGGYWILIIFSNSIFGRIYLGEWAYIPLGILLMAVWLLRLISRRK